MDGTTRKTASIRTASWWVYLGGTIQGVEPSTPGRFSLIVSGVPTDATSTPPPGVTVELSRFFAIGNAIRALLSAASQAAKS